ncbi:hypothetical protein C4N9_10400 [Pararhodobacter marinus]|uniref:Uncharacterized protein n=1 Tax=Pararhodobacter marinus TaxID=2184063 RepID=A0A2U2CBG7_9RHOB|nr:DUF6614 family protein [Pararhodobacter marinus]PWE29209.1 hypothetical protein C4N9_10400 [Pararhodobacter marinus]
MNVYHCMIDLKPTAKALTFAHALDQWLSLLQREGRILTWRLMRIKLRLGGDDCADFLLEIEVEDLAMLDAAFRYLGRANEEAVELYEQMHQHIQHVDTGLYRPYPDPERVERMSLL